MEKRIKLEAKVGFLKQHVFDGVIIGKDINHKLFKIPMRYIDAFNTKEKTITIIIFGLHKWKFGPQKENNSLILQMDDWLTITVDEDVFEKFNISPF